MPGRDIFLSYSSKDEAIVGLALEKLEAAGHRCWFAPRDIPPGEFYAGQIIQALRESRFVLLFFSAHSNGSEQVVREINFAVSQRLPLLVVRLDQTALSNHFEYLIRINQWLDVTHLSSDEERIAKIVAQVEPSLAKSGPKSSAAKAPIALVFGDFEILADSSGKPIELGRGGMGVTYRARQISMGGREVALKVIQPELLGDDNVRRRFLREAQLAGEIDHENVALVHLRGQEGDSYFYAMQLVEGVDLDRLVKAKGPLNVRDALTVVTQVASALSAANSKGLIHRDIKPSNIMAVRRRNTLRIKLIDFGLAKQVTQQDIHSSLSGKDEFRGTLAYASPEQCQAFPLDTRSDLYSLGVTLWFLLSGKVPFTGNLAAVSGAHVWAPLPLEQLPPLPEAVLELLKSLLAKNPADRPQTPGELENRAEALLRSLPSDSVNGSAAIQVQPAASNDGPVGPEADSTLIGAPVLVSYLEPAAGQIREDRFELLESLPEGVSGRLFRARERRGSDSRIVAVKFLHPSICAQEEAAESLKTQFVALQKLTLEHLLRYLALELGSKPPFLVREWVQGLPLTGVLRLKSGALSSSEVSALLEPLPGLLDSLASSGLSLITVRLSKLWARLPPELEPAKFESWVKQAKAQDWDSRLALDPLSLRSLVSRSVQPDSDVTLLPTSRSLALQQNRAGIQGRTPAQLLASVVYELLAGQPPQADSYRPLAAIPDNANQRLKHALTREGPDQLSASELWIALKADFPQAPNVHRDKARLAAKQPEKGGLVAEQRDGEHLVAGQREKESPVAERRGKKAAFGLVLVLIALTTSLVLLWKRSQEMAQSPPPTVQSPKLVAQSPRPVAQSPTPAAQTSVDNQPRFDRTPGVGVSGAGTTVRFVGDSDNGEGGRWQKALAEQWAEKTGNKVEYLSRSNDASQTLQLYQQYWAAMSADVDIYEVDAIWQGIAARHAVDLKKYFKNDEINQFFPQIIKNNMLNGKLVSIPWFTDAGILYYRTDLLEKYGYREPPKTWQDLAEMAEKIQSGERREGKSDFQGFVFEGKATESVTCNALEWIYSFGGGTIIDPNKNVTINNPNAIKALETAKSWIGTISPQGVVSYGEEEARKVWQSGNAAFMRNWPYAYWLGQDPKSPISGKFAVTVLPKGGPDGKNAACLAGWSLMISTYSKAPRVAADLVRFLVSWNAQKKRAIELGQCPTLVALYSDQDVLAEHGWFKNLPDVYQNVVARPSTVTGADYNQIATAFFQNVNKVLSREESAQDAVKQVEQVGKRVFR
jgi:trehalose/maltose transport system substrate-binding protein